MSACPCITPGSGNPPRAEDYLDENGCIALPEGISLITFLDRSIAHFGHALAYRYLDYSQHADGKAVELTWAEVGTRTRAIAARLQQVAAPGDRVAVLAPQGLDYVVGFFAAILAGNIALPLFAPELPGHAERLNAILHDARPAVFLTTTGASEAVRGCVRMIPHARRPRVIAIDAIPDSVGATFTPADLHTDDIAYLQYTSGSTRTPMGVEITHRAAGTNLLQMILSIRLDNTDIHGVSWLPLYHDMGLLMIGFPALYGGHLTFMSPMAFIRRPQRWIQALSAASRCGRVVSPAPNFAFELVAQRGLPAEGENINLSNVILINGSEPVNIESITAFTKAFEAYGLPKTAIKPSYGMAEATLFVSSIEPTAEARAVYLDREQLGAGHAVRVTPDAPNAVACVSCGRVARCQWAVIVDPQTQAELPDGEVGEIWLHGDNIGRGYWARPEETQETFGNKLQSRLVMGSHAEGAPIDGTWMRTGDLGVYLDGELYITGRIKDMILIDGRNHYPQDIEATVASASPAVRAGYVAAFSVPANEMPQTTRADRAESLVIIAERAPGAGRVDPAPVLKAIRAAVARRHGLPVADVRLVAAGTIPRTTSGKLARRACRDHYLSGTLGARN
ncbi:MAG: fatty acyl-AMP ligase [Mycobacterium sp.]|uniref:fatty acyl-AMP ligase n=1 Tax=Mycobacterium sp. TaxID=1785 RepID=UPI0026166050|nr:fatty acyl-AMP ligase [Mycobacterium sp.]MDI3315249.1 fatty acyl-AMP ligase [Mycobacterium sp.]